MIEGNTNGVPKKLTVVFGEVETDKNRNIKFPPEKAGKKLIKSTKEIWQEAANNIRIAASDNTAEILQQLENSKINKDSKRQGTDLVH